MRETALYVLVGFGEQLWQGRSPISTVLAAISVVSGTGFEPALTEIAEIVGILRFWL